MTSAHQYRNPETKTNLCLFFSYPDTNRLIDVEFMDSVSASKHFSECACSIFLWFFARFLDCGKVSKTILDSSTLQFSCPNITETFRILRLEKMWHPCDRCLQNLMELLCWLWLCLSSENWEVKFFNFFFGWKTFFLFLAGFGFCWIKLSESWSLSWTEGRRDLLLNIS